MFKNSTPRRYGVAVLHVLFVAYILAASVVSLADPHCRERTQALTLEGISVGVFISGIQLLDLARRRLGRIGAVVSLYSVARLLVGHHVRLGVAGGYTLGVTLAAIRCLCG